MIWSLCSVFVRNTCFTYYYLLNVWFSMMSGHGANPVFFNEKNKDWTSRTLASFWPPTSANILIPTQTHTHTHTHKVLLKVDVMCVLTLAWSELLTNLTINNKTPINLINGLLCTIILVLTHLGILLLLWENIR